MSSASLFHPAVAAWFDQTFAAPTAAQAQAWPAIRKGRHVLIAAPTGSGKTLAAFMAAIDALVRQGVQGALRDETQIVYVSPLKALSNDIQRNLEAPLAGIRATLRAQGLPDVDIRTWVRTGDTPAGERERMRRRPPHIVVTTPESLYILLGSESGRAMLATTRTVIVDEIHAVAPNKRGTHLALSLERLASLCGNRLLRIGLSATQKPVETVARFLVGGAAGAARPACKIVDIGHSRRARSRARNSRIAARSRDVGGGLGTDLSKAHRADRGSSHHIGVREHAPAGRAGDPASFRSARGRQGHRPSWQPRQGAAVRCRAAPQERQPEGPGGNRLARARHRYRRRGPGLPARLAAFHRELSATGRPLGTCDRGRTQGPAVSAVARRAGGVRGAHRQRPPRRARPACPAGATARRPGAADRRRGGGTRMERGRALCAGAQCLAVSRIGAGGFRGRGGHAGGGIQHAARPARRAHPLRWRQSRAARPPWRAPHRADRRRHDPGQRRLSGAAGAGEPFRRHR